MIRRLLRLAVLAAVASGVIAAVRALTSKKDPLPSPATPTGEAWPRTPTPPDPPAAVQPEPDGVPGAPSADAAAPEAATFREPTDDGACPDGYPIKAKLSSKIFHSPGQLNYDRTTPDRCYADAAAAEADGLRAAKR